MVASPHLALYLAAATAYHLPTATAYHLPSSTPRAGVVTMQQQVAPGQEVLLAGHDLTQTFDGQRYPFKNIDVLLPRGYALVFEQSLLVHSSRSLEGQNGRQITSRAPGPHNTEAFHEHALSCTDEFEHRLNVCNFGCHNTCVHDG